ncbi:SAM-dependent methyltransferase [Nonomuraea zeae]|uniref:SAM-dependent methyltransferase n=1 Tax=Nonomuraea zeae TaxID=1642303 RepID=UPI001478A4AA|nr:SAM-dependent methyltransferase [Nonomuraea zeae]
MPENDSRLASLGCASTARMYDAAQGGKQNFSADRAALQAAERLSADAGDALVAHQQHVHRVVRHLAGQGVDQFVLYGTGLPSTGQAHETIHEVFPLARVVYAEKDPYMLAHARAIAGRTGDRVRVVGCDLGDPAELLGDPMVRTFVDWAEPVAVGVMSVHEIPAHDVSWVGRLRRAMAAGSHLWLTALSMDAYETSLRASVEAVNRDMGLTVHFRAREQVLALFDGMELLEPGLVWAPQWRPDGTEVDLAPERTAWLTGVATITGP